MNEETPDPILSARKQFEEAIDSAIISALDSDIPPHQLAFCLTASIQSLLNIVENDYDNNCDDCDDEDEDDINILICDCTCPLWNTPDLKPVEFTCKCGDTINVCELCLKEGRVTKCPECVAHDRQTGAGSN